MVFSPTRLTLQILDDEADPEERDDLASQLNKVLLGLDPGAVMAEAARRNRASDTHPFSTTKSDPLLVGALIVTLANSRLLTAVIEAVKTWIAGRKCSVAMRIDDEEIIVKGASPPSADWAIKQFLARHAKPD